MLRQHYGTSPHWPALAQALDPVLNAFTADRTAPVDPPAVGSVPCGRRPDL